MNDVVATLFTALVDATVPGRALNALAGKFWKDERDMARAGMQLQELDSPYAWLRPDGSKRLPVMQGSSWHVYEGVVTVVIVQALPDEKGDANWDAARQSAETLRAAVDGVLAGLRTATSVLHPDGCWHELSTETTYAGEAQHGTRWAWRVEITCTAQFRRRAP